MLSVTGEATLTLANRGALAFLKLGHANGRLIDADYEKRSGEMEAAAADLTAQVLATGTRTTTCDCTMTSSRWRATTPAAS